MSLVTFPGGLWSPIPSVCNDIPFTLGSTGTINSAGDLFAYIVIAPRSGTLNRFEFRLGTVSNNPDNGLRVAFRNIDAANGDPDGTEDEFRVVAGPFVTNQWVTPGLITSDGSDTGTKRVVTAGDRLACVIGFESFVAGDQLAFGVLGGLLTSFTTVSKLDGTFEYHDSFDGATWTKNSRPGCFALEYATDGYVPINDEWIPALTLSATGFNSGSSPDERALRFQVPISCVCDGAWIRGEFDGDCDVILYDNADTVLATGFIDASARGTLSDAHALVRWPGVTLTPNTTYRVAWRPSTVTNIAPYAFTVNSAGLMAAAVGGAEWFLSTRTNAGAWTDVTAERLLAGLHFSQFDNGSAGTIIISTESPAIVINQGVVGY